MPVGFAPNWYYGQQNKGLAIYIAPGDMDNGVHFNGGVFSVPPNSVTTFFVTDAGIVQSGAGVPSGAYGIAQVTSGLIVTSTVAQFSQGRYPKFFNTDPGILNIRDLRFLRSAGNILLLEQEGFIALESGAAIELEN